MNFLAFIAKPQCEQGQRATKFPDLAWREPRAKRWKVNPGGLAMSQSDSFIEEVTEEVRRDQLYAYARRYGWIGVLTVLGLIGAVAWAEWRQATQMRAAQAVGDAVLGALEKEESSARAEALSTVEASGQVDTIVQLFHAAELLQAEQSEASVGVLNALAANNDIPLIYRQIAQFKALITPSETLDAAARRAGLDALAQPGVPIRLLAEEQLALLDIEAGARDAALERLNRMLEDSEVTPALQQRAVQVIVALGGTPNQEALGASERSPS